MIAPYFSQMSAASGRAGGRAVGLDGQTSRSKSVSGRQTRSCCCCCRWLQPTLAHSRSNSEKRERVRNEKKGKRERRKGEGESVREIGKEEWEREIEIGKREGEREREWDKWEREGNREKWERERIEKKGRERESEAGPSTLGRAMSLLFYLTYTHTHAHTHSHLYTHINTCHYHKPLPFSSFGPRKEWERKKGRGSCSSWDFWVDEQLTCSNNLW